ncbi:TOPRIM nucleotidyl transferase/hydrolase domain-containing protein [Kitasatospora sp. NPDC088391]|uniref:TOPRIM nucleotidyl transferase/hydrolase domain-containing protein n=1 Tax=Kitasatospora sp. NPDC088391 TaxID=3364074 RepID=UPI0038107F49
MAEMRAFLAAVADRAADPDGGADPAGAARRARVRTAVLLEGLSDLAAVEALAAARGRDLAAEGVAAVPMGGAMNVGRYAALLGPTGLGLRLAGLCDRNERGWYERGFARAGAPGDGIFGCAADLEDELVRALGPARIEEVFRAEGDLPAWRTFERQPAQRDRTPEQRLRRFLGTRKGRKIRYGRLLVEALDPAAVPAPLDGLFRYLGPGPAAHC